ncbi:hypothetical protein PNP85_08170 [Halobacterium salinarum]|uniref:hypothetical protein n=1 Tax=Halobacterium salinarum TaxID=2242 RepID=UPI00255766FE|nr:hypothetical protein [Halobacterium salinarum]MDL0139477.1 hypothetical protein [Halobacterium salinarum]
MGVSLGQQPVPVVTPARGSRRPPAAAGSDARLSVEHGHMNASGADQQNPTGRLEPTPSPERGSHAPARIQVV